MTSTDPYASNAPVAAQKTNVLAIVSLVSSFFISILGIILGFVALSQIKKTGESGRGLAIAGIIIGFAAFVIGIIAVIISIIAAAAATTYSVYY